MRQLFNDTAAHEHFEREGYVVLPFLGDELRTKMRAIHDAQFEAPEKRFATTFRSQDLDRKARVDEAIRKELEDVVRDVLKDCRLIFGNFAVKTQGERGRILPHQDWAIVDESSHVSIGVWSPLEDVNEENGMLCVMRQSHLHVHAFRGGASKELPDYIDVYPELLPPELVARYHVPLPMKAGMALFYDHRMVHYSPPNMSEGTRVAVLLGIVPAEAPLRHYYRTPAGEVEVFAIPDDYFAHCVYRERPDAPMLGTVPYECRCTYPDTGA